jgi:hypothetical protein
LRHPSPCHVRFGRDPGPSDWECHRAARHDRTRGTRRPSLRSWRAESAFQQENITIEEGDSDTHPMGSAPVARAPHRSPAQWPVVRSAPRQKTSRSICSKSMATSGGMSAVLRQRRAGEVKGASSS